MTTAVMDQLGEHPLPGATARRPASWAEIVGGVIVVLGALVLLALAAYDHATADRLLPGTRVGGVAVGGLSAPAAVAKVERRMPAVSSTRFYVAAGPVTRRLALGDLGVHSDAVAAVERARQSERGMGRLARAWHRLFDSPVRSSYAVRFSVQRARAARLTAALAREINRSPKDAHIDTSSGFVKIVPSVAGRRLDVSAATAQLTDYGSRLANGNTSSGDVSLPVVATKPTVSAFPHVLLVRLGENRLYHYVNGDLVHTYVVATGQAKYPTPQGRYRIVVKEKNPIWINPEPKTWGKDMPARIGPGPDNPLGTRRMGINYPGINIHGTSNLASLGTSASHGCIRMAMHDVESLYDQIPVGTQVIIIQVAPPKPPPAAALNNPLDNPNNPINLEGAGTSQ